MTGKSARVKSVPAEVETSEARSVGWVGLARPIERYSYPALLIAAALLIIVGQIAEDAADGVLQMTTPAQAFRRWAIVGLGLYELLMTVFVYRIVRHSVALLRPVVRLEDAAYRRYEQQIRIRDWRADVALLIVSAVIVVSLFVIIEGDLPGTDPFSSQAVSVSQTALSGLLVLAGYTALGWAGLKLLYVAGRFGRLLGRLSREPLEINVFDTTPLLPFGNIALVVALAPAGLIAILLLAFGAPNTLFAWTILLLASAASLSALLLPLRGIHHQMSEAKESALAQLNSRIGELFEIVRGPLPADNTEAARVGGAANALIPIRKTVQEMTTWPFRDTVAFARAVLIALAPLIYTTLSELIRVFVIGPLSR